MADEIVNRIAQSKLVTIDLEEFYPSGERVVLDISQWLFEGLILKEKDFRESIKNYNWEHYQGTYVALGCSTDAIIPSWAYLLVTSHLAPYAQKVVVGDLNLLETVIFQEILADIEISEYLDKPIIVKGCSNKPVPPTAAVQLIEKLQPVAKSIMFGEACSTVPLFKRKKNT